MTDQERQEIEALAADVCPYTYHGLPCERRASAHVDNRHWASGPHGQGCNWPTELSDQRIEQAAS